MYNTSIHDPLFTSYITNGPNELVCFSLTSLSSFVWCFTTVPIHNSWRVVNTVPETEAILPPLIFFVQFLLFNCNIFTFNYVSRFRCLFNYKHDFDLCLNRGRIYIHVWPFHEWAVSNLDRSMHRSLWV